MPRRTFKATSSCPQPHTWQLQVWPLPLLARPSPSGYSPSWARASALRTLSCLGVRSLMRLIMCFRPLPSPWSLVACSLLQSCGRFLWLSDYLPILGRGSLRFIGQKCLWAGSLQRGSVGPWQAPVERRPSQDGSQTHPLLSGQEPAVGVPTLSRYDQRCIGKGRMSVSREDQHGMTRGAYIRQDPSIMCNVKERGDAQ